MMRGRSFKLDVPYFILIKKHRELDERCSFCVSRSLKQDDRNRYCIVTLVGLEGVLIYPVVRESV